MTDIPKKLTAHRQAMREVDWQIRSNRPLLYIVSHEEKRIMESLREISIRKDKTNWVIVSWDISDGLSCNDATFDIPEEYMSQKSVLQWFGEQTAPAGRYLLLVLKDYQKFMGSDGNSGQVEHEIVRKLRNLSYDCIGNYKAIIFLSSQLYLPSELEKTIAVIDWPLPEKEHIEDKVTSLLKFASQREDLTAHFKTKYNEKEMDEIVRAFQGLTLNEIELIATYIMLTQSYMDPKIISGKKRDVIRKSGLLEWIEVTQDLDSVGGLHELKRWLNERKDAFTIRAKEYGLPENPSGILLVGVQGAGKSLASQAIASGYGIPLLRLDMGKIFSSLVGSSEENIRAVIKVAESVAPCLLWADEMDKGFSGSASSNHSDGGTAARVLGTMLTWMQDKKSPVFVVATANDVTQLPPELLRKGRFDEIFFVDLPSDEDRLDIFKIHLKKRNRNPDDFNLQTLVKASKSYTGAEIEASIVAALYKSFSEDERKLTTEDIEYALESSIPLSVTMKEKIDVLRAWAETRARNASVSKVREKPRKEIVDIQNHLMAKIDTDNDKEEL